MEAKLSTPEVELDLPGMQLIIHTPEWTGTLTTPNGDTISGEYSFRDEIIPFTGTGDFSTEADLVIVDGTGKFKGVKGKALAVATANIFTGTFHIELKGKINKK